MRSTHVVRAEFATLVDMANCTETESDQEKTAMLLQIVLRRALPVFGISILTIPALAHEPPPVIPDELLRKVTHTVAPPVIDGVLDDAAWEKAEPITNFTQVIPAEGAPPSEVTEMRLLYDSSYLYIAFRCFDSQPDQIVAAQMQRDISLNTDDHLTIIIDPFDRARSGYEFQVSAAGGLRDGLVETDAPSNYDWRGLWTGQVHRDEYGWTAEIAIPFNTISFDRNAAKWGFNVQRYIPRTNETIRWASPLRNTELTRLSAAGGLVGLEELNQGIGLKFKPFVRAEADLHRDSVELKPGFDLFYSVNPTITLTLTVNTDFAETEVDDLVINLTRFPTFLPEKRDFFLQDAGVFEFGGIGRSPLPFFSRRIGIVGGEERDILAGARLTGRHESLRFGLMNVQMKHESDIGSKNLTVARGAVDVLEESSVGFIFTHGDPATRGDNTLGGVDFNYLHRDPATGNRVTGNFFLMGSHTNPATGPGSNTDPLAIGARIGMPNEPWRWQLGYQYIGADFNPALGFVQRRDRRVYDSELVYRWRPRDSSHWIRHVDVGTTTETWTFSNNEIEQSTVTLPDLTLHTRNNWQYYIRTFYDYEKLVCPFEIVPDVFVAPDRYDTLGIFAGFRTNTSRPIAMRFEGGYREFYTGHRTDFLARLRLRPSRHFFGGLDYERTHVDLGHDRFTIHVVRSQANILFTPTLSWNNIVQWDSLSENFTVNSRIRWEFRPGQEVFLVYNENMITEDNRFHSTDRRAIVKLGMTLAF